MTNQTEHTTHLDKKKMGGGVETNAKENTWALIIELYSILY